ncbi:MAG: hypothetical protein H0X25_20940 [Acidobacteriales bacterium]|nr:hypothetical protein [Terriglobales bacterium]
MSKAQATSCVIVMLVCASRACAAQQTMSTGVSGAVPPLVNFSTVLKDANGKPVQHLTGRDFRL